MRRRARAVRLRISVIVAATIILLLGWSSASAAEGHAVHYQQADIFVSAPGSYAPPTEHLPAGAIPVSWTKTALPHVVQRSGGSDRTLISTWYRVRYAAAPSGQAVFLYVPRWQVTGKLAIYADRQLIYAPRSGPQWMSFNMPIWVKLADAGTPPPSEILININSVKSNGGGISSLWIGDEGALSARYALRHWLQVTLTDVISFGDAIFGCGALIIWIWWRREPAFLLLVSAAAFNIIWEIQFRTGEAPHLLPEPWFGWMTICALQWWILSAYLFSLRIIGARLPWLTWALLAFTTLFTLVTLPISGPGISIVSATLSPLLDVITLVSVVVITVSLWIAFFRKPSHEGLVVCIFNTLWPLAGVHDVLLQTYKISLEAICTSPMIFGSLLFSMIYIMVRRYLIATTEVEQYALRLESRVREREAELEASHARLRAVERRETVTSERQRLMREMHDGMGSSLMGALAAVERGRLKDVDVAQMLRECVDDLKLTIDSLETVDTDLPLVLATLRYRLGPRFEQAGIALTWRVSPTPPLPWLDAERALHVLRMVQEMFTNIVKHAAASQVTVTTIADDGGIVLMVEDNGVGFSAEAATRPGRRGLANLTQRAHTIGAALSWTSEPGATRFELRLPFRAV